MARALYEKREFVDRNNNGTIIQYDFYGVQGVDSNGEMMELRLQNLNSAEKLAFKMIAVTDNPPVSGTITSKKGGNVDVTRNSEGNQESNWLEE